MSVMLQQEAMENMAIVDKEEQHISIIPGSKQLDMYLQKQFC